LTAPFPETPLGEVADWAATNGFESLEVACWPRTSGPSRRYAGTSHIDVAHLSEAQAREIVDENWEVALQVWPQIVDHARDNGVKVTIENCPMIFSRDEWPGGNNIAWSPYIWRRIIAEWGDVVGLNYDPSHLVWLMIDQPRFIREFGPNIFHVQAKDVQIDWDKLYERGSLSGGIGWQIPRLPGLGDANWADIFSALWRAGYDGDVIIEHEDRDFEGTDELVKRGFLLARDILRPYIK
jgi:sugar phosphate isomerase/epimerase